MTRRLALIGLGFAAPLILATFFLPGLAGQAGFAFLAVGYPVALIALGAAREGRLGPLRWPIVVLLMLLEVCVALMLALRGQVLEAPWVAGLPLAAAVQLGGMWLAPLLLVALAYALTFEKFTLRDEDLERLRRCGQSAPNED